MDESNTSNKKQRQSVEKSDTWLKKTLQRKRKRERCSHDIKQRLTDTDVMLVTEAQILGHCQTMR